MLRKPEPVLTERAVHAADNNDGDSLCRSMFALKLETTPHACCYCRYFLEWTTGKTYAVCAHPGCSRVRPQPQLGCSCFEREPGAMTDE